MPSDIVRAVHSRELKVKLRSDGGVLRLIICSLSLTSNKSDCGKYSIAAVVLWTLSLSVKME